jgi:hypothetical protein
MLPANEWWGILGGYGAAIWPAQWFLFSVGLVLMILLLRSRKALVNSLLKRVKSGGLSGAVDRRIGQNDRSDTRNQGPGQVQGGRASR